MGPFYLYDGNNYITPYINILSTPQMIKQFSLNSCKNDVCLKLWYILHAISMLKYKNVKYFKSITWLYTYIHTFSIPKIMKTVFVK